MLSDGSRRWSCSRFQTIGPATENARRLNLLRQWRGTIRCSSLSRTVAPCLVNTGGPSLSIYTGLVEGRPTSVVQSEADTSSRSGTFGCQWWHELLHSSCAEAHEMLMYAVSTIMCYTTSLVTFLYACIYTHMTAAVKQMHIPGNSAINVWDDYTIIPLPQIDIAMASSSALILRRHRKRCVI